MMDLRDLYQDIILDHGRNPRNFHELDHPSHVARGHNPLCGDRVTVFFEIADDRVKQVAFQGQGCAISTASASLMTEILTGKRLDEVARLFAAFHAEMTGKGEPEDLPEALEEDYERLAPLSGVKDYPTRVKCATLAWHAVEAALKSGGTDVTPVKTE